MKIAFGVDEPGENMQISSKNLKTLMLKNYCVDSELLQEGWLTGSSLSQEVTVLRS